MKISYHFKILDKNIKLITNSIFLKDFIKEGLFCFSPDNKNKPASTISSILRNPEDINETFSSFLDFVINFLKKTHHKYWILHASAFTFNGQATIVLGNAGSGKSSFLFSAGLWGAKILSDEPVLIEKRTSLVSPFRYLLKMEGFHKNFKNWNFASKWNFNKNRITRGSRFDFTLFRKADLKKLNINLENKKVMLKNIVFLEEKKFDSVIHLSKHCLNVKDNLIGLFKSLNNLIGGKDIKFIPNIIYNLKDEKKMKNLLRELNLNDQ